VTLRVLTFALAAALLAAGCGGDESNAETWADDVCSSVVDWRAELGEIAGDLTEGGQTPTAEELRTSAERAGEATEDLADDLREAGPPDTEAGEQAAQELEQLGERTESRIDRIDERLGEEAESASSAFGAAAEISTELSSLAADFEATFQELEELDPGGELQDAFRETDSCEELRGENR
jgi:DNA anti-recombination protein RmuC